MLLCIGDHHHIPHPRPKRPIKGLNESKLHDFGIWGHVGPWGEVYDGGLLLKNCS